ncbi:MAG: hypothetical protein SGARI_004108 [Bacillariaceae sp.]
MFISDTNPTLNLDANLVINGFDNTMTCGELNDLCANGWCDENQCPAYVDQVSAVCGCRDTQPDFTSSTTSDTTIFRDGPLFEHEDPSNTEDTMLVQKGEKDNENLPAAYALMQFTLSQSDYDKVKRLGFAEVELCLHHVEDASEDKETPYTACIIPDVQGENVETISGDMVNYVTPGSCSNEDFVTFNVSPTTGRVCMIVTEIFDDNVKGPGTITFMIDGNGAEENQPGDRFYTQEDSSGRRPTLQLVDRPYDP